NTCPSVAPRSGRPSIRPHSAGYSGAQPANHSVSLQDAPGPDGRRGGVASPLPFGLDVPLALPPAAGAAFFFAAASCCCAFAMSAFFFAASIVATCSLRKFSNSVSLRCRTESISSS
ncbi:hypothetical protein Vafri_4802, partial [Volvox africanus]